jgi:hypothetical protein
MRDRSGATRPSQLGFTSKLVKLFFRSGYAAGSGRSQGPRLRSRPTTDISAAALNPHPEVSPEFWLANRALDGLTMRKHMLTVSYG